jgi:enterochelin esterase-like enzyme
MTKTALGCVLALAVATAMLEAQGGRGRAAGPAGPIASGSGTIERITVHGTALEGNLEGDSPDRDVTVYLPPAYASDQSRRFPVVYLLHGYGGREDTFTTRLASLRESGDRLAIAQGFSSAIVVTPSAYTLHKGSMYSNSPTTGDWERFVAEDLVAYMDKNYRTLPSRLSRGLAGHSMGGYGALKIGMKRAGCVRRALRHERVLPVGESQSATRVDGGGRSDQDTGAGRRSGACARLRSVNDAGVRSRVVSESEEPTALSRPSREGRQGAPRCRREMGGQLADGDAREARSPTSGSITRLPSRSERRTRCFRRTSSLHAAMTKLRIPHYYEEYDGDHTNKVRERIEQNVLPFFARNLAAPANPTNPQISRRAGNNLPAAVNSIGRGHPTSAERLQLSDDRAHALTRVDDRSRVSLADEVSAAPFPYRKTPATRIT